VALLLLTIVGCARPRAAETGPSVMPADTVWYISARARDEGRDTRDLAPTLEYGLAIFRHATDAAPRTDALELMLVDSVQLAEADFVAALARRTRATAAPQDFALFYVHGFGTSLHEAWTFAASARVRGGSDAPWIAFCWPSNGAGIARPTLREPLSQAYVDDSTAAVASGPAFDRALRAVVGAVGASQLLLVAHSLGGQLVGETLAQDIPLRTFLGAAPLRAIAFVAPDVEARRFTEYTVPALEALTDRLVLYTSSRDRVLEVSGDRSATRRAGRHRSTPLSHAGLETVDATDGLRAEGWLQRTFGNHHAIGQATASLFDLSWIVGGRRPPDCRRAIGSAESSAAGVWVLANTLPAAQAVAERCPSPAASR
jgi:esterase/lipase superfamily enzyme